MWFDVFLEKYGLYEIQVSASTIAGDGNETAAREFRTDEDSKLHFTSRGPVFIWS